ncbi:MAG: hypothetical protein JXB05_04725 [Myxococcaceae bacterium]|nr:hypothetical protein [Myxococcaceae bacterium]
MLNYAALDAEILLALHERFKDLGGAPDRDRFAALPEDRLQKKHDAGSRP